GQPQAGAQGDAGTAADPTSAAARAQEAARLLPGRAAAAAVAARHVERLGRRARLVLPDGDHRLLHPRDRRLAARAAPPRRRGTTRDRRLRRPLPPPPAQRARLPDPDRGTEDVAGWDSDYRKPRPSLSTRAGSRSLQATSVAKVLLSVR